MACVYSDIEQYRAARSSDARESWFILQAASLLGLPPGNLDLSAPGEGSRGWKSTAFYSFLQLANFVSFNKVFSTKLIEIDNIYDSIREILLSNAIFVELEEVDG